MRSGYSVASYGQMVADANRTDAYVRALERAVQPGCVVLDIGAGTGIFSLLACRFGARRVYAVEPDGAIQAAREIAAANGYAERIEFIQDLSTRVTLPERADVIISDLHGVLPLYLQHLPSIMDARARHLAAGGALIPRRDTLWAAPVESQTAYQAITGLSEARPYGFTMEPATRLATNLWQKTKLTLEQLLSSPELLSILDYRTVTTPNIEGALRWEVARAGEMHGLAVWFDSEVAHDIGFSNAPGKPELIYGQAFFPLSEPVTVEANDIVTAFLAAHLVGDDYVWRWDTSIHDHAGAVKNAFQQSTFFGRPVTHAELRKRSPSYRPALDAEGQIQRAILERMDGNSNNDEIAAAIAAQFPERFPDLRAALTAVGDLSRKYSR